MEKANKTTEDLWKVSIRAIYFYPRSNNGSDTATKSPSTNTISSFSSKEFNAAE